MFGEIRVTSLEAIFGKIQVNLIGPFDLINLRIAEKSQA